LFANTSCSKKNAEFYFRLAAPQLRIISWATRPVTTNTRPTASKATSIQT